MSVCYPDGSDCVFTEPELAFGYFFEAIPGIARIATSIVLTEIKFTTGLSLTDE